MCKKEGRKIRSSLPSIISVLERELIWIAFRLSQTTLTDDTALQEWTEHVTEEKLNASFVVVGKSRNVRLASQFSLAALANRFLGRSGIMFKDPGDNLRPVICSHKAVICSPGAAVLYRPFQDFQVSILCSPEGGFSVPRTSVRSCPL